MSSRLSERQKNILKKIIDQYISFPEPISSRTISKSENIRFSSATIRLEMMELEEKGYLDQKHCSSGRTPTNIAYRFYINYLMELEKLSREEEEKIESIRKEYEKKRKKIKSILKNASQTLASITQLPGLSITPSYSEEVFRNVELILVDKKRVLVLLLTQSGIIKNMIFKAHPMITQEKLNDLSEQLNIKGNAIALDELELILKRIFNDQNTDNSIMDIASKLKYAIKNLKKDQEIVFEGASKLMNLPEFHDSKRLEVLFRLIEEKNSLVNILNNCIRKEGIRVLIGSDINENGLSDFSLITSPYRIDKNLKGTIGILGPTRLQYPKVITVVSKISDKISELLSEL